ncbi:MAG: S8 family serine peptidase, partial [Phycisphaerae bacterium]
GVTLLRYLGDHAYFASFSEAGAVDVPAVAATPSLVDMQPIQRAWKLDPKITAGTLPHWAVAVPDPIQGDIVGVYVLFHEDVSLAVEAVNAVTRHGAVIRDELESINGLVIELPLANVGALADEDAVQWIEWPMPRMGESNDSNRVITEADQVQAAPYNLDGNGVTVLVYDGGTARSTHVDFQGRLTTHDGSPLSDHSTHVAGTIGGAGVANASFRGMAPGTTLLSYGFQSDGSGIFLYSNPGDLESDYNQAINSFGADIANNSIGTNTEVNGFPCSIQGDYGVTAALIDAIVGGSLGAPFRVLWANGNERQGSTCDVEGFGAYYSTAPPSGAKNHITIGALNSNNDSMTSFSSWGPVDDGRIKPDVSGPGCQSNGDFGVTSCSSNSDTAYAVKCGTSMATPTATGLASLLLEDFRVQFPGQPDFRNSTLKALLAHNAQDILNTGPDYQSGYGSLRIRRTVDFMRTGNFLEDQVGQGGTFSVLVSVSPGDPELKVTLAWDDVPGTPNVNPALVNDLDLRVFDPGSTQFFPWTLDPSNPSAPAVQTQADHVNNIEQVVVNAPAAGTWRIEVAGFNVPSGPQSFSLCASPILVACSSQGTVALDAAQFGCAATAGVQVIDCDLNTDNFAVDTVTVTVASTSEPGGEPVVLTETAADTADFRGSIALDTVNSAGVLLVAHGDTVTATYVDASDGQGGVNITRTDTAGVNCVGPVISNVQTTGVGSDAATVTFNTDTAATGTVRYGTSCGALTASQSEAGPTTSHSVLLSGLNSGTVYFYAVDAVDEQGNPATDDNFGACYSFTTSAVAFDFPMDVDPGWTTQDQWAFGQPTGGGGQHGGPDPTSGFSGPNVYGYNLNGDYPNNLPERHLTSTALDCTGLANVKLRFWRWLGVEQPAFDHAYVRVSNNGSTWTTLWQNTAEVADTSWVFQEFDISAVADNQPTVFLRWTIGTTDFSWQYCGWNLDDVQIIGTNMVTATCTDGVLNQGESRIDCGGPCPACQCTADAACDNAVFCDGAEACDAFGICQAGTPPDCNDGVGCTDDACNEAAAACDHIANDANCDNGVFCDGAETCDAVLDCQLGTAPCVDSCQHCVEAANSCDWCIFDLDASGTMGTGDFSLFAACFGACYAPGDPCLASDFDGIDSCVGTGDYAAYVGCFGVACADCPTCGGAAAALGGGIGGGVAGAGGSVARGVAIQLIVTDQPGPSDFADGLRKSMPSARIDQPLFVEVWADPDVAPEAAGGLAAVYVDVTFDADRLVVDEVMPGALFETLASGVLHEAAGRVFSLGGCAAPGEASLGLASHWVRVATLRLHATRPGRVAIKTGAAQQPYGVAMFGTFGDVDPSLIGFGDVVINVRQADVLRRGLRKDPAHLRP